jgi:predicted DNA-binding transcriptional regulator AlpA
MRASTSSKFYGPAAPDELLARNSGTNNTLRELLDRDGAAKALHISPRTLDRWHLLRIGPPRIKIGGRVRYRLSAILEWLRSCETIGPRAS